MAPNFINLVTRDHNDSNDHQDAGMNHTIFSLLVALLALLGTAILLVGGLWLLRKRRNARKNLSELPLHNEKRLSSASIASNHSNHRRNMKRPSASIHVYHEKQNLIDNSDSPPTSPVPEIRITFPDETDSSGKRQSGRVVVVHVGDKNVGLEPVNEDLPAYQKSEDGRFQSLDLDRIGGLTEKETTPKWS